MMLIGANHIVYHYDNKNSQWLATLFTNVMLNKSIFFSQTFHQYVA